MFSRIKKRLKKFWTRWLGNPFLGVKLPHISDSDLRFDGDIQKLISRRKSEITFGHGFISYSTQEDYNKDFIVFYKAHRSSFYLDYSQSDGHFRV